MREKVLESYAGTATLFSNLWFNDFYISSPDSFLMKIHCAFKGTDKVIVQCMRNPCDTVCAKYIFSEFPQCHFISFYFLISVFFFF